MQRADPGDDAAPCATAVAVLRAVRAQLAGASTEPLNELFDLAEDLVARAEHDAGAAARRARPASGPESCLGEGGSDLGARLETLIRCGATNHARAALAMLRAGELAPIPSARHGKAPAPSVSSATTAAAIAAYLRDRGDERELLETTIVPGGFSKETVLLRLRSGWTPEAGGSASHSSPPGACPVAPWVM